MGRFELNLRGAALLVGLQEPPRAETPAIPGLKARKAKFWPRGAKVISEVF